MLWYMSIDVDRWLNDLGLDQYAEAFLENDVDHRALPLLTGEDLKELGVSLGHRKILLAALRKLNEGPDDEPAQSLAQSQAQDPTEAVDNDGQGAARSVRAAIGERRHLTVLFADLVGSTELTNRLDQEDMRVLLQKYQDAVAGAVSRYGGFVAKYLGDGLLVFFGWPRAYEDHTVRALKAGLESVQRVNELTTPDGTPLAVRLGVASGEVVVGDTIGENTYEESAVTGPILNLAARIQGHAPPNAVVVPEEETEAALHQIFEFSSLGAVTLKGFDEPRTLLQVVSERSAESRFRAMHQDDATSELVGRGFEKDILDQAWQRARDGKGEVILLSGEAGIGKSRLTEEFLAGGSVAQTADIIRLNCSPYLTSSPFHPVAERISQDAKVRPDFDDDRVLKHVVAMLEIRQLTDLDQVLPVFAALVAPRSRAAQDILRMSPKEQRDATIQTLVNVIKNRAHVRPIILFVEDAHWIDPSTKALLNRFTAICSDLPLLVLVTHRPGWEMDRTDGDTHVHSVQLRRFDAEQVTSLVRTIFNREPNPELVATIVEKTDGVPLFIEELTRAIKTSGQQDQVKVPASLMGTLMARLDAVSSDAKQVALTAAVIGREFEPALLVAALSDRGIDIRISLEELRQSGLIFESGQKRGHYVFRHALLMETAYRSMLRSTRRTQHANVATALKQLRSAEIQRRPELIARHLTEAEDWAEAFERWAEASEMALARSASREALANANQTLAVARHLGDDTSVQVIAAKILLGRSYDSLGRLPDCIGVLGEAWDAAQRIDNIELAADAANHFADTALMAGERHRKAIEICLQALAGLPEHDEVRRCGLMSQLARAYSFTGQFDKSSEFSRKTMELAAKLGDYKAQFGVMMARFGAPYIARDKDEVRNWRDNLEAMHRISDKLGNIDQGRDRTLSLFAGAEMADRQLMDQALESLTEISQKDNHLQLYWVRTHARAMVAILDGDFPRAEQYASEAVEIGRQTHGEHVEGVYGVQMFTIRREQSRLHEVAPVIKRLMSDSPGDISWKPGFGLIAAELGYKEPAERILNELAETGFELSHDAMYSTTLSYLADICVSIGHLGHVQTIYDMLAPYEHLTITAGATTVCTGAGARRLGSLAALMGDWDTAEKMFETAIEVDTDMKAPPWIAHSKTAFAAALRRRGRKPDFERAVHLEAEALATARKLGMISLRSKLEDHAA